MPNTYCCGVIQHIHYIGICYYNYYRRTNRNYAQQKMIMRVDQLRKYGRREYV